MILAVDGPAASGKGTVARALARHYGLPHLDTGLLYRAVAQRLLDRGEAPEDADAALAATGFDDALLGDPRLKTDEAGKAASILSAHPAVRAALVERQRRFAMQGGGAVLDGRDIGTVIAPDADVKLYVQATSAVRARRRHDELRRQGSSVSYDRVLADLKARDLRDSRRATAPLRKAADAMTLDTTFLSADSAVAHAIEMIDGRIAQGRD